MYLLATPPQWGRGCVITYTHYVQCWSLVWLRIGMGPGSLSEDTPCLEGEKRTISTWGQCKDNNAPYIVAPERLTIHHLSPLNPHLSLPTPHSLYSLLTPHSCTPHSSPGATMISCFCVRMRRKVSSLLGSRSLTVVLVLPASWCRRAAYCTVVALSMVVLMGIPGGGCGVNVTVAYIHNCWLTLHHEHQYEYCPTGCFSN